MKLKIKVLIYTLFFSLSIFSQIENDSIDKLPILPKLSVLDSIKKTFVNHSEVACMDSMWMKEMSNTELSDIQFEDILKINPDENVVYDLNTDLLKERLAKLDAKSPFNIEYNIGLENVIKSLLKNRKKSYERLLGISQYYFPLFEEALSKYNIPIEVKYLAIVESALNPKAKSRVGATGLWQFMYNTGLQYKLDVNSYIDERSDPIKATEAACKYLSGMYNIFGDWDLVLASYNCGPGNVTKAIRRSNGQTNYWNIRKNLPRETAGYLPAFLATMYIMEYHNEHGINKPKPLVNYFATDTIVVKKQLSFNQISRLIDIPEAELQFLNPSYKLNIIPVTENKTNYLRLPQEKIAVFTSNEDKIYYFANYESNLREKPNQAPVFVKDSLSFFTSEKKLVTRFKKYKVRKGDNLGEIASKFDVTIADIKKWNGLRSNNAPRGKNLKIQTTESVVVKVKHAIKPENNIAKTQISNDSIAKLETKVVVSEPVIDKKTIEVGTNTPKENYIIKYEKVTSFKDVTKSYKVKKGDNLSEIADKFNVSTADIKKWNKLRSNSVAKGKSLKIITNEKIVTTVKRKEPIINNDKTQESVQEIASNKTISKKEIASLKADKNIEKVTKPEIYQVKKGDNINLIAEEYGVAIEDIKFWNKLKSNKLTAGKKLKIFTDGKLLASNKADKPADDEKFEVYYSNTTNKTESNANKPGKFIISKELNQTYKVKKGDNIYSIAKELELNVDDIKEWNNLKSNKLKLGQVLKYIITERVVFDDKKSKNTKEYTVVKGDNLNSIAKKNNVTIDDLKSWNNLDNNNIALGTKLIISNQDAVIKTNKYIVAKGDNIWKIAEKFNTTAAQLKDWNHLTSNELKKGMSIVVSESENILIAKTTNKTNENIKSKEKMYLVKKGDSLFSISQKYPGVTVADIKKWNDITNGAIKPGMKLKIII